MTAEPAPATAPQSRAYATVAAAIRYLQAHRQEQPSLAAVARHVGLSEFHLQRLFADWAGVSPKQYLQFLTRESAKQRLREGSVLATALATGLSGSSRLHDLMVSAEGMTPGEYRLRGKGLAIRYGIHDSPFGTCLLASTPRGICKLAFTDDEGQATAAEQQLRDEWPAATIHRDDDGTAALARLVFPAGAGPAPHEALQQPLRLLLRGSPFQLQVWAALLAIPAGELRSYQAVAASIGQPTAVRAVASAIARNDIGYLIPCHRVIRATGEFSHYRWGDTRKQAMIAREGSTTAQDGQED